MITRRTILAALGVSTTATIPAAAAAATPDERIDAACAEIKQALYEKYGWAVNVRKDAAPVVEYVGDGKYKTVGHHRHVVLIDAAPDERGTVRWHIDHGGPLYAKGEEA